MCTSRDIESLFWFEMFRDGTEVGINYGDLHKFDEIKLVPWKK